MWIATTGALSCGERASIVYRGRFETIFPQIAGDGYRAVELHIADSTQIDRAQLNALLVQHHLRLTSIGTGMLALRHGYTLTSPNPEIRCACIEHLRQHMLTAQPHGALVILGCVQGHIAEAQSMADFRGLLADSLCQLDRLAARHGVTLALEVMNRFEADTLNTLDDAAAFVRECGFSNICLHIDTVHLNIEEAVIGDAIMRNGSLIGHVHIADNDRWYPGHAHYNFHETLTALRDIGYTGALALETRPLPDTHTSARRSLQYLQSLLDELGVRVY